MAVWAAVVAMLVPRIARRASARHACVCVKRSLGAGLELSASALSSLYSARSRLKAFLMKLRREVPQEWFGSKGSDGAGFAQPLLAAELQRHRALAAR